MSTANAVLSPATSTARAEKELLIATRAFTAEHKSRSWWYLGSTVAILAGLTAGAIFSPWSALRAAFAVIEGLTIVRLFCLFHDYQHGALLRGSKSAEGFFWLYGLTILTPASVWKETHNYHHAHTAKIVGSHIGSYPLVTVAMWKQMTPVQRALYKFVRSPLNMVLAIFTVFTLGMAVKPVVRAPRKHWSCLLSLAITYGLGIAAYATGHFDAWVFGWFIPMAVAASTGAYLFYAQHNFPEGHIASRQDWTFATAATDSSSFLVMSPLMNWFTANIGYHHVHHLNAAIPFYRLPEAMQAIPELQDPGVTTLSPKDVAECFKLKVWDAEKHRMVGYPSVE